jgi:hypothetical protein
MNARDDIPQRFLARIRQELDKLPLTETQKDVVIPDLLERASFLDTNGGRSASGQLQPDSTVFEFANKIQAVVKHFQNDGLTIENYLPATLQYPQLMVMNPNTITANIEGVVERFASDGLTTRDYIKAALKQSTLFYQSPATIAANIEGVVERFTSEGLTTRDYIKAALKRVPLFTHPSKTIAGNITGLVERFASEGLTTRDYIKASLKFPALFYLSPDAVASNVTQVVERFAADGLTTHEYLKAALQQPSLFAMSPDTVARHVNAVLSLADEGAFIPPIPRRQRSGPSANASHALVIEFLLKNPYLLCLADDNYGLRDLHQRLTDGPTDSRILTRPRHAVERELMQHLGHEDPQQPVATDGFIAGGVPPKEEQAKRFMLRALIHAGYIRSGSLER